MPACRRLSICAIAVVASTVLALTPDVAGAKGRSTSTSPSSGLTLSSQDQSLNPNAPSWCTTEDDVDNQTWTGSLSGSFDQTFRLCDANVDYYDGMYWDAGGIGLEANLYTVGDPTDLTITSPSGAVQPAVLVGSSTSKGATTNHYEVCVMPNYSLSTEASSGPLPGGNWTVDLTGSLTHVTYSVDVQMGYATWQQDYCPASEQNISQ